MRRTAGKCSHMSCQRLERTSARAPPCPSCQRTPTVHSVDDGARPHPRRRYGSVLAQQRHAHHRVRLNIPIFARTDTSVRTCVRTTARTCARTCVLTDACTPRARRRTRSESHGHTRKRSHMDTAQGRAQGRARNRPCRSLRTMRLLERSIGVRPLAETPERLCLAAGLPAAIARTG